jgi:hypothetical protein
MGKARSARRLLKRLADDRAAREAVASGAGPMHGMHFAHDGPCVGYPRCSECWHLMQVFKRDLGDLGDQPEGGVREPRRPKPVPRSGVAAQAIPKPTDDVVAVSLES